MEYKRFQDKIVIRVDKGEEIVEILKQVCKENNITLGSVTGIGAVEKATLGLFKTQTKEYKSKEFSGEYELAGLVGNISTKDGETYLHLHATLSDEQCNAYGGHLNLAVVSATSEIVVQIIEGQVERLFDNEIGLNLYKF